jgi:phosphatidylserine synthase
VLEYVGILSSEQTNTINWYCAGTNQDNILAHMIIVWQASNAIYCCRAALSYARFSFCSTWLEEKNFLGFSNSANSKVMYLATLTFTAQEHHDEKFL